MVQYELPGDFMDLTDDKPVPEGIYAVIIDTVEEKLSREAKSPMINCMVEIEGHPDAGKIFHNFMIPTAESKKFANQMAKRFLVAFGIDYSAGIDPNLFPGARCEQMHVALDQNQNGDTINVLRLPKLEG